MLARDLRSTRRALLRRAMIDVLEPRQMMTVTELIQNGNFASNSANWTTTGDFKADATYNNAFSAPGYAYLAAADGTLSSSNNLDGTISQTVTIPATSTSATLSYWFKTSTEETAGSFDTVQVRIKNTSGTTLATVGTIYNTDMSAYQLASSIDLTAYAGQTISLSFDGHTNETNGTIFRIDNVSLQADVPTPPPPPASLPAPTLVSPGTTSTVGMPTVNSGVPQVRWNAVAGATGYGVIFQKLSGSTYTTVFNSETSTFPSPITGTTFSPPVGFAAGTYRWQVRAFDSTGKVTAYAPALYFSLATTGFTRAVGIDISSFQTVSSWANIKTNSTATTADDTSFIYAKATEGYTFNDSKFASFVTGARSAGIPLGGYHFARPGNNAATDEATHFYNVLVANGALQPDTNLIPMLDFEDDSANTVAMGKTALTQWLNDFCAKFTSLSGIVPVIYTYVSYATSYISAAAVRYPLWQAQYPSTAANPTIPNTPGTSPDGISPWSSGGWAMWQFTSKRTVSGIGTVDSDVTNSDVATFLDAYKLPAKTTYAVSGTIFEDTNSNGTRDSGEVGVSGRTVFIDADGDGVYDTGEATTTTNSAGAYSFSGLLPGNYQVRQVVPSTSAATTALVQSFKLVAGSNPAHDFGTHTLDTTPPTIATSAFAYQSLARPITIVFSEDIGTSLVDGDAVLTNTTTGAIIPTTVSYTAATKTAVFTPTAALTNGDYTLTIAAGNITDLAGNPNAAMTVNFFSLNGDINRDRSVNFDDLILLAQNYNKTGATYVQGDLTGDGVVNFDDLIILAQNYNGSLPAQAVQASAVAASVLNTGTTVASSKAPAKKSPASQVLA